MFSCCFHDDKDKKEKKEVKKERDVTITKILMEDGFIAYDKNLLGK
jgi:hypothetical protein